MPALKLNLLSISLWFILSQFCTCSPKIGKYDNIKAVECNKLHKNPYDMLCVSSQIELGQVFVFRLTHPYLHGTAMVLSGGGADDYFQYSHCYKSCEKSSHKDSCSANCYRTQYAAVYQSADGSLGNATFFEPRAFMLHTWPRTNAQKNASGKELFNENVAIGIRSYYGAGKPERKVGLSRFIYNGTVSTLPQNGWEVVQSATSAKHGVPWVLEQKEMNFRLRRETIVTKHIHNLTGAFPLALNESSYDLRGFPAGVSGHNNLIVTFAISSDECTFLICGRYSGWSKNRLDRFQVCYSDGSLRSTPKIDYVATDDCHSVRISSKGDAVIMSNSMQKHTQHYLLQLVLPYDTESLNGRLIHIGSSQMAGVHGLSMLFEIDDSIRYVAASTYLNEFYIININVTARKITSTERIKLSPAASKENFFESLQRW